MKSPAIAEKVSKSLALAKKFNANETPTIILNSVLKVTPTISGGTIDKMTENLELIIGDILGYNLLSLMLRNNQCGSDDSLFT